MYDFILVGQGLAGSLLAYQLIKLKQKVLILNDETLPSSSLVAAGIFNPITGKRLGKTWLANELFSYLETFYTSLEKELEISFFYPSKIYRPFTSVEQQNYFLSQTELFSLENYLTDKIDNEKYNSLIFNELSGLETSLSGWIDIPVLLKGLRNFFIAQKAYLPEKYSQKCLKIIENKVIYNDIFAKKIIFAEGYYGFQNPLFSWIPNTPVKGEVLTIRIKNAVYDLTEIINQGIFILPIGNNFCRVGSTYSWDNLDFEPTQEAKQEITKKLAKLLRASYEITEQVAGIRPASEDRRPYLGFHPIYKNIGIFNGLGTKGVSLAPYFSKHFVDFLINSKDLLPEVNIERFYSLFCNDES